jgi:hypothetical protein
LKKGLRRWVALLGATAILGGGLAYGSGFCEDCEPCMCMPDGSYGLCCGPSYPC